MEINSLIKQFFSSPREISYWLAKFSIGNQKFPLISGNYPLINKYFQRPLKFVPLTNKILSWSGGFSTYEQNFRLMYKISHCSVQNLRLQTQFFTGQWKFSTDEPGEITTDEKKIDKWTNLLTVQRKFYADEQNSY